MLRGGGSRAQVCVLWIVREPGPRVSTQMLQSAQLGLPLYSFLCAWAWSSVTLGHLYRELWFGLRRRRYMHKSWGQEQSII